MHHDDDIIIKDEDDDAPQPRATASSSLTAFSGGQGGLFPAGSSLVWPSSMPSTSVQRLVDLRDDIFAGQRKAYMNIDELEESEMLVDDLFKKQMTRHMKRTYEAWNRFCLLAKVPQFPIAYPLLGLCVAAHYSSAQVCARSFAYQIKQLRHLTEHLWTPFDYVSALDDLDPDGEACFSFVRERRKATRTAAATSADEDLESSDDERAKPASKQDADRNSTRKSADAHKLECPGFPQPHQEFASHEALYSAFLKAVVPVYGVTLRHTWTGDERVHYRCAKYGAGAPSSRCQYYLVGRCDPDTSFWHFDPSTSILEHTHGPDSRIIVDPTWRPAVTSPVIVRALGLDAPSRSKFPLAKRRRSSASSSKLDRKGGTKKTTAFSSSQASRRRLSTSPSPVDNGSLEPGEASSGRRTATAVVSASGSGTSGSRCGTSSSRPSPFVRPAIPARAGPSFQSTARTSVFAPAASTSAAPYSPVGPARPDARAPPAPSRALVTADALVGSYLLELEPSGSLQVLVPLFVARGLTTWRTLSELKDPAAARKLCADIIPAASSEVVNALLHFVQLVAR